MRAMNLPTLDLVSPLRNGWQHFADVKNLPAANLKRLPRVRVLEDWGTYKAGDVFVVVAQLGNTELNYANYRGVPEGEPLPEFLEACRAIPAEVTEPFPYVKDAVVEARENAKYEALRDCPFVRSRGVNLATLDGNGQCDPAPEADCHTWGGSIRELRKMVELVQAQYPNVTEVYLGGGFDGSLEGDSLKDFLSGAADYAPWASEWTVTVWTRKDGWKVRL